MTKYLMSRFKNIYYTNNVRLANSLGIGISLDDALEMIEVLVYNQGGHINFSEWTLKFKYWDGSSSVNDLERRMSLDLNVETLGELEFSFLHEIRHIEQFNEKILTIDILNDSESLYRWKPTGFVQKMSDNLELSREEYAMAPWEIDANAFAMANSTNKISVSESGFHTTFAIYGKNGILFDTEKKIPPLKEIYE